MQINGRGGGEYEDLSIFVYNNMIIKEFAVFCIEMEVEDKGALK